MDYLMGIDLGSTSLKAVVYDLAGQQSGGRNPAHAAVPPGSGTSRLDGLATGTDLGRHGRRDSRSPRSTGRPHPDPGRGGDGHGNGWTAHR